jgi:hypothetical protein
MKYAAIEEAIRAKMRKGLVVHLDATSVNTSAVRAKSTIGSENKKP